MDRIEERADFLAQHPLERVSAGKDGGHVHPELRERSRDLGAYEAHAHDDRVLAGDRFPLDRLAFSDSAQVVDARQVSPGNIQPPVPSARGDQ